MTTKIPPPAAVKYDLYYLECVQPAANHRKFYLIFRANIEVTTVFGRIGTQGKTATSIQLSSGIAQAVAAATAGKKISGGYKQLTRVPRNLLSHLFKYISEYTYEYVNPPALAARSPPQQNTHISLGRSPIGSPGLRTYDQEEI